ncbi:phosphatase PAP2 family protein [Ferruginibacter paludis]|uniref:phosphatase PAP2 family protein n=1 Tax=Ferruginibacter paludis TaxID=1310417 RepID=UPI0025B530CF|nr:phosphatase PAP2 family protein [Ferruginibacter paludis]MDN3656072.1 phosphatase PAP2 family protein [Ferruginibacter paludis]
MTKIITTWAILFFAFQLNAVAQNWDIDITKSINPQNPNSGYWKFTSGSTYFISAAIPVSLIIQGASKKNCSIKQKGYEIFGAIAIEVIISETMKEAFHRQRPAEKYPLEVFPYKNISGRAFPSGHTSLAFATAASLSLQYKKWFVTVPAYLWSTMVAYSRIYLGVHYPSDVLAGAAVGIGSAYLSNWLHNRLFSKNKSNQLPDQF